jgi:hypothetical protein
VNPGVSRLAIVVALVIVGVALLANGFSDGETTAAPRNSSSPSVSDSPSPSRSPQRSIVPNQEGVLVQVLNGTSKPGLAADFQTLLVDQGGYLEAGTPGDAPDKPVVDSVVYFRQDDNRAQNRADAQLLSETYLGGVPVKPLPADLADPPLVSESADVVVVLGDDQAGTA